MLAMRTGPVLVTGYDHYLNDDKSAPMRRKDGTTVEFVTFVVDGEERPRSITLDSQVNGSRAAENTRAELIVESRQSEDARMGKSGRPYIARSIKFRVVGFEPVGK
jgi:hypothetical protein